MLAITLLYTGAGSEQGLCNNRVFIWCPGNKADLRRGEAPVDLTLWDGTNYHNDTMCIIRCECAVGTQVRS